MGCLHGEDLAFAYRTVQDAGPVVLVVHPREALLATGPRHVVSGDDKIRVWARSASPVVSVQARVNRGEWQLLERTEDSHWAGGLSAAGLAKGTHRLEVEAQDESGQIGRRAQEFVVDATGRYTAVPAVRPLVAQTQFC